MNRKNDDSMLVVGNLYTVHHLIIVNDDMPHQFGCMLWTMKSIVFNQKEEMVLCNTNGIGSLLDKKQVVVYLGVEEHHAILVRDTKYPFYKILVLDRVYYIWKEKEQFPSVIVFELLNNNLTSIQQNDTF